ncbi:MAG: ABC transporter substrate-binding protein [Haloarculaceae archaeon]
MSEHRSRRRLLRTIGTIAAAGSAGLAGCSSLGGSRSPRNGTNGGSPAGGRTVTDAAGRTVSLPASVDRVVALGPGGLRFVTYADGADRVVGVEQLDASQANRPYRPYTLANPGLTEQPTVGTRKDHSVERILEREPDVVIYGYADAATADTMAQKLGVPVVSIRPGGLTQTLRGNFFDSLDLVGTVLGTTDATDALRETVQSVIGDLTDRADRVSDPPRGYVGYLGRGKHGLTFTQPGYVPFALGGVENVAADATGTGGNSSGSGGGGGGGGNGGGGGSGGGGGGHKGAPRVQLDSETLVKWDPAIVFVDLGTESYGALDDPAYQGITAIENGEIYATLPTRDYGTNFATVLADAYAVGAAANPDVYDVDPAAKADELYEAFVGEGVYGAETDAYGGGFGKLG